jgi:hypothetical protein
MKITDSTLDRIAELAKLDYSDPAGTTRSLAGRHATGALSWRS